GVLGAARMTSERPYDEEDVMALEALAERAALALAEAKLHPSVIGIAEYEAFFRHSIDGVIFAASNGRILAANPAACDILGRSEADIARAGRSGVFVAEDRTRAAFAHLARHGGVRAELPMRRGTGEVFTADVASTLFMTDEGELRATTIFRDATERVRAQEQLARQRDRLALLHLVSTAINQATDMDEAVRETLDPVGEAT